MSSYFDILAEKREARISELDRTEFAPAIRNHLLQLFRKAHAADKGLTGVLVGMGRASASGTVQEYEDSETFTHRASNWHPQCRSQPRSPDVLAFLEAVADYDNHLCNGLGYVDSITLADLTPRRVVKARTWRKRSGSTL